jgi:serine/threonine protein kinase
VSTDRIVALKLIRGDLLASLPANTRQVVLDRFRQEVQAAARLEHDHIVTVYDGGETEGHLFLAMRFVRGQSLGQAVRCDGRLAPARAARYIASVARAVEAAHQAGIVHRNIKPQNLLIDEQTDRALITDFGVAKLGSHTMTSTQQGDLLGTPGYMSPEQYRDAAGAGAPSDVYSLGATLYTLLTGELPFDADTPWEMMRQVLEQIPPPPSTHVPGVDPRLDAICLKCLHKEAQDRYATAEALADDLDRYLGGEPVLATRSRIWRRSQTARRPRWVLTAGFVLVPIATFAATSVWEYNGFAKGSLKPAAYLESETASVEGALHDQSMNGNEVDAAEQVLTGLPLEQATADEVEVATVPVTSDWVSIDGIICWGNDRPGTEVSQTFTDKATVPSQSDDRRQPPPGVQWDRPLGSNERPTTESEEHPLAMDATDSRTAM